jgi:hypothetical protein
VKLPPFPDHSPTDAETFVWTSRDELYLFDVDSAAFRSQGNSEFIRGPRVG